MNEADNSMQNFKQLLTALEIINYYHVNYHVKVTYSEYAARKRIDTPGKAIAKWLMKSEQKIKALVVKNACAFH